MRHVDVETTENITWFDRQSSPNSSTLNNMCTFLLHWLFRIELDSLQNIVFRYGVEPEHHSFHLKIVHSPYMNYIAIGSSNQIHSSPNERKSLRRFSPSLWEFYSQLTSKVLLSWLSQGGKRYKWNRIRCAETEGKRNTMNAMNKTVDFEMVWIWDTETNCVCFVEYTQIY